ncbi:unnamed protein product [Rotaria magnacalcarata]|nr:unnamed protein product [Rotaria magnacalcarata]
MYKMNTQLRQIPLPNKSLTSATTNSNDLNSIAKDDTSLPNFVSRGLQTDLESQPLNSSSTQMVYYEKQQPQVVPISAFPNYNSSSVGFYHLTAQDRMSQPTRPPMQHTPPVQFNAQEQQPYLQQPPSYYPPTAIQQVPRLQMNFQQPNPYYSRPTMQQPTPVPYNVQQYPSLQQPNPYYPPLPPPPRTSILKKPSTVLSQDAYNPLSARTHDQMLEELRKRNSNIDDGVYRVKKVHLLEKSDRENYAPRVSFNLPSSKATQSISRSEKLLSSELFDEKK